MTPLIAHDSGPSPCVHPLVTPPAGHCKTCGKPTRSHKLTKTVTFAGGPLEVHETVSYSQMCPTCNTLVVGEVQAVQCHVCYLKEHPEVGARRP